MILGHQDLVEAEQAGDLAISDRLEFECFSTNLRLGRLYRQVKHPQFFTDMPTDAYLEEFCEEVAVPASGLEIGGVPERDFFLWTPYEEIHLAPGMRGLIASRSSWARLGSRIKECDDLFVNLGLSYTGRPLCSLKVQGTRLLLKPRDALAQLFVKDTREEFWLSRQEVKRMIVSGELEVERNGKRLSPEEVCIEDGKGHLQLTLGEGIKVYTGGLLVPGTDNSGAFEDRELSNLRWLPKGLFFLGSNAERVGLPKDYVGEISEICYAGLQYGRAVITTHANAPWIAPKNVFNGQITLENQVLQHGTVVAGMPVAELTLHRLKSACTYDKESRYNGQNGATTSRLKPEHM